MHPSLATVLTDAVAWARWGPEWSEGFLACADSSTVRPVIPAQQPDAVGWFLGGEPGLASVLWFMDHGRAERAAIALAAGGPAIDEAYKRWSA